MVEWSTDNMMDFIGEPGVPTQRCGHVLDLTFSNILWAQTTVRADMHCGSDHETQVTIVPGRWDVPSRQQYYRITEADLGKFTGLVEIGVSALEDPWSISCEGEANAFAEAITRIFKVATENAGRLDKEKADQPCGGHKSAKTPIKLTSRPDNCRILLPQRRKVSLLQFGRQRESTGGVLLIMRKTTLHCIE